MKSKQDKLIETKMLVKKTEQNLNNSIAKYDAREKDLISLAAVAKNDGRINDYKQTISYLKMIIVRKEKTKSLLHQFKMLELFRDDAELSKEYINSMRILSKETSKIYGASTIKQTSKEFRKMMANIEKNQSLFDYLMNEVDTSCQALNDESVTVNIDEEINQRVNAELEKIQSNLDSDIDKKLNNLKKI